MNQVVPIEQQPRLPSLPAGGPVRAIVPQDFEGAWRIASAVCKAGMAPRGLDTPEKAMVAIMHGLEVGLTPMNALQSIAVVNGRPTVWGDGAIGLARGSGLLEWMEEKFEGQEGTDAFKATCIVKRKGEPKPIKGEFSIADAKVSGLWTKRGRDGQATPWQHYPKRMLQMRARAFALRDGFADVLKGLAIKEEVEDYHTTPAVARDEPPAPPQVTHQAEDPPATPVEELVTTQPADEQVEWSDVETATDAPPVPPEAKKPDPISTGRPSDFPGDKPMKSRDDGLDIPDYLRRTPEPKKEAMAEWLVSLSNALSGCEDTDQLREAQAKYQAPMTGKVPPTEWEQSRTLILDALKRITGD